MVIDRVRATAMAPVAPRGPRGTPRSRALRIATRTALAVLALLLLVALVGLLSGTSAFNVAPATTSQYRPIAVAALMVLASAALVLSGTRRSRAGGTRWSAALRRPAASRAAWWTFVAACLAAQLVLAHAVLQFPTWDATQIFEVAYHLAVAPEPRLFSVGDQSAYFSLYPNNFFLVAVLRVLFGVLRLTGLTGIDQYLWASVVVNCLALTGSLVLIRTVARRLAPGVATTTAVAFGVVLVVLSPWLSTAYSDTLAMAFPIGMLALWLTWPEHAGRWSRVLLFVLLGVLAGFGLAIKPPAVFMAGALLLATFRAGPVGHRWAVRSGVVAAVAIAVGFGLAHEAAAELTRLAVPAFSSANSMPFSHFMAMGATGDGGFNADDFNRSWALPPEARSSAALRLWEARVTAMGPLGYPLFLAEKMLYGLSDGSFFQDREGIGPYDRSYFSADPFSAAVQAVFPLDSPLHWLLASAWQAAWWSAVLLCFVPLRRLRLPRPGAVLAMRGSLLLLLAFLCLSESRSRYLYHYLPVVLVLAGLGAAALVAEIRARRSRAAARTPEAVDAP